MNYYAYHLALREEEVKGIKLALLPGAPERCCKIASAFGDCEELASHREFKTVKAESEEGKILVVSTGIGGPSLSIAVEELAQLGVRLFLRVGTCGAIQEGIAVGDLVISEGAVRMDGASPHYAPLSYPACAHWEMVGALKKACELLRCRYHLGITCSSATFYPGQERYDTFSGYIISSLRGSREEWKKLGVLNYEMEIATLFTVARVLGLRSGAICGVLVNRNEKEEVEEEKIEEIEDRLSQVAAEAARLILSGEE